LVNNQIYHDERSKLMENKKIWLAIPLVSALVLAVAVGVMAFSSSNAATNGQTILAQDLDTEGFQPSKIDFGGMRGLGHGGKPGFGIDFDHDAFIAEELGVTVEELQAARQAAQDAALEQAVTEGVITAEQAELIRAGRALREYIDQKEILSQALGIDVTDLEAAREEGKSLPYLLGELGLEPADFQSAMQSAYEDAIQQAVEDGVITSSEAEQLQEKDFGARGLGKRGFGFHGRESFKRPAPGTDNDM
jgi:hypothetical protein